MKSSIVLMYHRVGAIASTFERKYCVSPKVFESHMKRLAAMGMRAVAIDDYVDWLEGSAELPDGAFLLTFDDGFLGVYEHAYPLLLELGWPATVFLVSALVGKQDEWSKTENPSGVCYPLLDRAHIGEMRANGFSFNSHTRHHKNLTSLAKDALDDQLVGSKQDLESILGCKVRYLAYPYGLTDARVQEATRTAGYRSAFSVQPGFNRRGNTDMFHIRRLDVFGSDSAAALARKVRFGTNDGSLKTTIRYYASRVVTRLGGR